MKTPVTSLALFAVLADIGAAHAALVDRGGGLIYDDVLKITWLQDANYAKTSLHDADGKMTWAAANTWAANLVYHDSVRNIDLNDWRLPTMMDTDGPDLNTLGNDGCNSNSAINSTDCGYNVQTVSGNTVYSEMAHMYFNNLGLKSAYSPTTGLPQSDFGIFGNGAYSGQRDIGLIKNLQASTYWFGLEYAPYTPNAWYFNTSYGRQQADSKGSYAYYAWAVRDGDVAAVTAVPVPAAAWLFGSGLLGLIGVARRKAA
ncbi:MAG: hypothetical protein QG652_1757 [Pseudomonadota bacterium]|nr:hypothetical protein [Pseudomonadota bacterium]